MGRNLDDVELLGRCLARAPGAWRQFVDRFGPTVRALARRYLRLNGHSPDDAELDDAVQDVFLAVTRRDFRLLRHYDPTYAFKTYLGVITRTQVHRFLRKKRPLAGAVDDLDRAVGGPDDAAERAAGAEEREVLQRALDDLPIRDAEILRLRFLREYDYKTIARRLEIPEASVGQTLYRAKRRLLDRLKGLLSILV